MEPKFEAALARLEEIVDSLEAGDADLEKALKLFEEGISLVRVCDKQLKEAEQKLEQLNAQGEED
ncbi:MAG: exodeoxyribonuclease VII small subunit [Eubacteriales bacterium]|nr:exodeoxyribonuclease VII small subunit [Eubacteriales bacterium]MDD3073465.1 exodeoxyribonuclease VII small subunit [Eubacteriales bacterium]MDD4078885.1 exodeoxyribonuclease VII small subunit [Eubacteriales bacterium]MDD4768356.1 exodeoxyribonuclease VII small subunit [Eubacteriales bacterium]